MKFLNSLFYRIPFLQFLFLRGIGFSFMLHRILPEKERGKYLWNKTLGITPNALEYWVSFLRNKGYEFISMDEAVKRVENKSKGKRFIALTIDDGYKDNFVHGLPIFEKLKIPVTIYVSSCFLNKKAVFWWYFLEDYINQNNSIDLNVIGIKYKMKYLENEKKKVYDEVRELLRCSDYKTHIDFAVKVCQVTNLDEINKSETLTWEELRELSSNPLVTIGGHTNHHISLNHLPIESVKQELVSNKTELEEKLGFEIKHFAYPYGTLDDVNVECFSVLKGLGFKSAVLNYPGSIFKRTNHDLFDIPRMGLSDETTESRLNDLINGKIHMNFIGLKKSIF